MEQQADAGRMGKGILMGWLVSGIMTVLLMVLAAGILFLTDGSGSTAKIFVYGICIIAVLAGGWTAGHKIKYRKFLWGLLVGCLYYLALCILSALSGAMNADGFAVQIPAMLICLGSGMLGGMLG